MIREVGMGGRAWLVGEVRDIRLFDGVKGTKITLLGIQELG
jgi:hypothetical protein